MSAGELRERLRFERRPTTADDGYGNVEGGWRVMFEEYARVRPMTGSETVISARLAGVQPVRMTVRSSTRTRQITTGWRAVDMRDENRVFNITAPPANLDEKNAYLDIMAQLGVPT
jgi:head-tail adaptor